MSHIFKRKTFYCENCGRNTDDVNQKEKACPFCLFSIMKEDVTKMGTITILEEDEIETMEIRKKGEVRNLTTEEKSECKEKSLFDFERWSKDGQKIVQS